VSGEKLDSMEPLPDKSFCFECHPGMSCFTACCARLDLKLSPYDILRVARRLELTTTDFLEKHTTAVEETGKLTRVKMMMNEEDSRCPFVTDKGCTIYEDRPAACRTYPLGRASSPSMTGGVKEAYFLIRESHCDGHGSDREWTVDEWMKDQEISEFITMNDLWMEILTRQSAVKHGDNSEQKEKMFNLASYDLDTFRKFVLEGGLLNRLELPDRFVEKLRTDDIQLLRFAFSWLKLALFGEMNLGLSGR
jgi:uncharacterized protein